MKKILVLLIFLLLSSCFSKGTHLTFINGVGIVYRDDRTLIDESFQKTWYIESSKSKNGRPYNNLGHSVTIIDNMVTYHDGRMDLVKQVYYSKDEKGIVYNLVFFYERDYSWILKIKDRKLYIDLSEGATVILTDVPPRE